MTLLGQKVRKWGDRTLSAKKVRARSASLGPAGTDTGDEGAAGDASIELMEGLIRQRLKMFEPHIEKWMQVCRDWQPEHGLSDEVVSAVRSLVEQMNMKTRPMTTVIAVAAAKKWRKAVMISKLNGPKSLSEDDDEHLPPITPKRPSRLSPAAAHRQLKERRSSPSRLQVRPSSVPPQSLSSFSPDISPRQSNSFQGSLRWQVQKERSFSSEVTDLLRNLFLARLCDALHNTAKNLPSGQTDWSFVNEGVKLLHWICRQSSSLRPFCEAKFIIQTLIRLCEHAPSADITRIITLLFALRTFLCASGDSEEVQHQRVAEATSACFFRVVVKRLPLWMDSAILDKKDKNCRGNQVLDLLHDLVLELLKHESMRDAAVDADFVPSFTNLVIDRLLSEPLVWPRSLPLLMDAVTALPHAEYVQCGIELSKALRHAHVHKGIGTLPSVLSLRMNSLRQRGETPEGSRPNSLAPTPEGSRRNSLAPTPPGSRRNSLAPTAPCSKQGDFSRPCAPTGPSPTCRSPLTDSSHRQRRKSDSCMVGAKRRRGSEPAVMSSARRARETEAVCEPPVLPLMPPRNSMGTSPMLE